MSPKPLTSAERRQPHSPQTVRHTEYPGKDLDAMAFASNYRRWIMDSLKPYIGRHVVEVGAGTGAFSELLLAAGPASLTVLEPSSNLYSRLIKLLALIDSAGVVHLHQSNFPDAWNVNTQIQTPDTAVYINVLEHIEDDETELKTIFKAL